VMARRWVRRRRDRLDISEFSWLPCGRTTGRDRVHTRGPRGREKVSPVTARLARSAFLGHMSRRGQGLLHPLRIFRSSNSCGQTSMPRSMECVNKKSLCPPDAAGGDSCGCHLGFRHLRRLGRTLNTGTTDTRPPCQSGAWR
jgi:hypothetical protein